MSDLQPKIRFPGFTDDWEQRKFGDQMYLKSRVGWQALTKSEYLEKGDYYLITGTDIDETTHTVDLSRSWYVSKERYEMDGNIQVHDGDLIITKDGTIGKVAFIKGLDKPATLNSHLFLARDLSGKIEPEFLFQILNSWVFQTFIEKVKTGSTLTGLPQKTMVEFQYSYPSIPEQKQISSFLGSIDQAITLHQRELDYFKELKTGLLSEMFPKEGQVVPNIRFPGFTGDWEQRKLGELLEFQNGLNGNSSIYGSGTPLISVLDILQDEFITAVNIKGSATVSYKEMCRYEVGFGDVLFQRSSENFEDAGRSNVYLDPINKAIFGGFVIRGKKIGDYDPVFMRYILDTSTVRKQVSSRAQGAQHINVSQDVLEQIIIHLPSLEEQRAIGSCFKRLDDTITLHQNQLDYYKELKTGLLQNMFI